VTADPGLQSGPLADRVEELLDEESLAVLAILLAVALEFGFGFAKTVVWWSGLIAGPAAFAVLALLLRLRRTHVALVRVARWTVQTRR
jgi:nitrate reductase NapE component